MLYDGEPIGRERVRLVAPAADTIGHVETGEVDDAGPWSRWFGHALESEDILYFSIEADGEVVGEIFVHDIAADRTDATVGYRVFDAGRRGAGTGTVALALLLDWIRAQSLVGRLFIITRDDNAASRRLAERAGFSLLGPAREDARRVVYELATHAAARSQATR